MIEVIKQQKITEEQKVSTYGDILCGEKYFFKPTDSFYGERKFVAADCASYNVWSSLKALGINTEQFQKDISYECPFTEYMYYWAVPIFLFSENVDKIIDDAPWMPFKSLHKTHDWAKGFYFKDDDDKPTKEFHINKIAKCCFMGAGHTVGTLPCDGGGERKDAIVELSNGDYLGCKVWVWFNN